MKNQKTLLVLIFALSFFTKSIAQSRVAIINTKTYLPVSSDISKYELKFEIPQSAGSSYIEAIKTKSLIYPNVVNISDVKTIDAYELILSLKKETEDISGYLVSYFSSIGIDHLVIDGTSIKTEEFYIFMRNRNKQIKENNPQIEK